jgi:hypothetical protein
VKFKVPQDHAIRTKWTVAGPFYRQFAERLHQRGIRALTTGGNACIVYALAQQTKDCDLIVPLDKSEEALECLAETVFAGGKPRYYLKYGAPFSKEWLAGGWSSHTFFGPADDPTARIDFFARPPRVSHPGPDEAPLYLSRDGVARMKKTRRLRDWAYANLLGIQMIREKGDVHGLLHINSMPDLLELAANVEIPSGVLRERPLLKLAQENSPDLERYIKAEMEFWQKLDDLRLSLYTAAWRHYGERVRQDNRLPRLDLLEQHRKLVEIATESLEADPIAKFGEANLVGEAKRGTMRVFGQLDLDLLPTPTILAGEGQDPER